MVRWARSGDPRGLDVAATCELALLGIRRPSIAQVAGAKLRMMFADDVRVLRAAYVEE